jgi:hypothetical protein
MNEHVHPIMKAVLDAFDPKAKDMSELIPTLDQYDPLAMADRFKAEQAESNSEYLRRSRSQQLADMIEALGRHTKYSDRDYFEMQTIGRVLEYLQGWIDGEHDNEDILMLIRITLMAEVDMKIMRKTIATISKAEAKHV